MGVSGKKASRGDKGRSLVVLLGLTASVGLALLLVGLAVRPEATSRRESSRAGGADKAAGGGPRDASKAAPSGSREPEGRKAARKGQPRASQSCRKGLVVSWRLVSTKTDPELHLPGLDAALALLRSWWRIAPDPYARSLGKAGPYMVGLARPDVAGFIAGRPAPVGRGDPGPSSGLSEAMTAVLIPPPGAVQVVVSLPPGKVVFQTWAGVVPRGRAGKVRFSFDVTPVDGTLGHSAVGSPRRDAGAGASRSIAASNAPGTIHEEVELLRARGRWIPVHMDLTAFAGRKVRISITTSGPKGLALFVADPLLWTEGCLPGNNILIVVIDTMRADAFDLLAGRQGVTPNMDALAARGVSFDQVRSLGTWTRPSMTSIFASDWGNRLGVSRTRFRLTEVQRRDIHRRLRNRLSSLYLRRLGYFTEAVGNNFFFLEHTPIGLDRGFERVVDIRGGGGKDSVAAVTELSRFLPDHRDKPFFLWVHLDGSHWPYLPPKGYSVRGARAPGAPRDRAYEAYLGEVRWSDEILGRILDLLKQNGLTERTLVAVTADHGETFADAHCYSMGHIKTRHAHGWSVYEELLHVPLVMAGPGLPEGVRVSHLLSHVHLLPTLLDYAGVGPLPGAEGRSLRPVIEQPSGPAPSWLQPVVSEGRRMEAIHEGRFKYIRRWGFVTRVTRGGHSETVRDELYDLDEDPLETRNLAAKRPGLVARLRAEMARILEPARDAGSVGAGLKGTEGAKVGATALHFGIWAPTESKSGEHELAARIVCRPKLAVGSISAGGRATWMGPANLRIVLPSAPGRLEESSVILGCNRARLSLELDGKPLPAKRLRVGPYGLNLLERYDQVDESVRTAAEAPSGPIDPRGRVAAVYLWTTGAGRGASWPGPSGKERRQRMSPKGPGARQVDQLLQKWGYSKDH